MPVLILAVAENLDKLLQDGGVASVASLSKLGGIMEMAVHLALVFVIGILGTEYCGTHGASEMFDMIFAIQGGDVGATKSTTTFVTEQVQTSEIIDFTERVLSATFCFDRKEFRRNDLTTVLYPQSISSLLCFPTTETKCTYLTSKAFQMICRAQGPHELTDEGLAAFLAQPRGAAGGFGVRPGSGTRTITRRRPFPMIRRQIAWRGGISCTRGIICV